MVHKMIISNYTIYGLNMSALQKLPSAILRHIWCILDTRTFVNLRYTSKTCLAISQIAGCSPHTVIVSGGFLPVVHDFPRQSLTQLRPHTLIINSSNSMITASQLGQLSIMGVQHFSFNPGCIRYSEEEDKLYNNIQGKRFRDLTKDDSKSITPCPTLQVWTHLRELTLTIQGNLMFESKSGYISVSRPSTFGSLVSLGHKLPEGLEILNNANVNPDKFDLLPTTLKTISVLYTNLEEESEYWDTLMTRFPSLTKLCLNEHISSKQAIDLSLLPNLTSLEVRSIKAPRKLKWQPGLTNFIVSACRSIMELDTIPNSVTNLTLFSWNEEDIAMLTSLPSFPQLQYIYFDDCDANLEERYRLIDMISNYPSKPVYMFL